MSRTCVTFLAVIVIIAKDELCHKWDLNPRPENWKLYYSTEMSRTCVILKAVIIIIAKDYTNEDQRLEEL